MTYVGVDAGGTWIKVAKFDATLKKVKQVRILSGASKGKEYFFDSMAEAVRRVGGGSAIGLALPGLFSKDNECLMSSPNVADLSWGDTPVNIREMLGKRLGIDKMISDNDAACAALAEWQLGKGEADAKKTLLHITWGTGIGTGLIVAGKIQSGWQGGHMPVSWQEKVEPCACGSPFDLEAFAAVPGIVKRARSLVLEDKVKTRLSSIDFIDNTMTPKVLVEAAEEGDELAMGLLREALMWLARGLHQMSVLAFPDIVTVGGGMMEEGWLVSELQNAIRREAIGFLKGVLKPEMVSRAVLANDAGMLGAAILVKQAFSSSSAV